MADLIKTEHLSVEKLCFDHLDDFAAFAMDSSISYMFHYPMERKSDVISYVEYRYKLPCSFLKKL